MSDLLAFVLLAVGVVLLVHEWRKGTYRVRADDRRAMSDHDKSMRALRGPR